MADVFLNVDAKVLLKDKHILFLGDSNIRAQYKDLLWLLNYNTLIDKKRLRAKLENSYIGDELVEGCKLDRGRNYQEIRHYLDKKNETTVEFMFIARCYNDHLMDLFDNMAKGDSPIPDVIIMNSCLWDITRWGPNGVPEYKDNMVKLMRQMKQSLPNKCLVIWSTALPPATNVRGGLLIKQISFMEPLLRFEVLEANTFARDVVVKHGFDVVDHHYYIRMQMHRRNKDGVHFSSTAVRFMTNLLLTHICLSRGCELPKNVQTHLLDKAIAQHSQSDKQSATPPRLPKTGIFARLSSPSPTASVPSLKITFNAGADQPKRRCLLFENAAETENYHQSQPLYRYQQESYQQQCYPQHYDQQLYQQGYSGYSYESEWQSDYRQPGPIRHKNKKKKNKRKKPYNQ